MNPTLPALLLLALSPDTRTPSAPDTPERGHPAPERPPLELRAGERYFRAGGQPTFLLGRNPTGRTVADYELHFRHAAAAGERFMRIHFTHAPPDETPGEIKVGLLKTWDAILDAAESHGLAVLPVLGLWSPWNDGTKDETWHLWDKNPFNAALGGPATLPADLFADTPCRRLWLKRLETLVRRWSHRRAIVAWEIFSELDLVTGATEEAAVEFAGLAAAVIRESDPCRRPVTASQAGVLEWPKLLSGATLDFIQIHPYADNRFGGRLDDLILSTVLQRLEKYGKPVLIGESGLSSRPPHGTLDAAPRAEVGIRHAIWAAVVSGAMNGRALWWQDGYDQFESADLCRRYDRAAAPAAAFVRDVDFSGFVPIPCTLSEGLRGAMIGNQTDILGWFRDARCEPPDWPMQPTSEQTVALELPRASWRAEFFDTATGESTGKSQTIVGDRPAKMLLPTFRGSLAIRLKQTGP